MSLQPTSQSESLLRGYLAKTGFFDTLDWREAWRAYRQFSGESFDCAADSGDMFLWETGVFDFTGRPLFHYSICRQFILEDNGEYDHMEQLHLCLYFKPDPVLTALEDSIWSSDFPSADAFFDAIEQRESFTLPISRFTPIKYALLYSEV